MIEGLKPYSEYKESGSPWLGSVPAHWRILRIKAVLREKDARSRDGSGTLLSLTRNRGLVARSELTDKVHSARTLVGYKAYNPGEIVMNRMQAWSGMFGAGPIAGLVSPDYAVFQILDQDLVGLLLARIKAPDMVSQFALASKGIGSGFNRLYSDRLGAIAMSLPPLDEQAAILRFLDHANRKIDGFIRAKRKLIGLLNEQKQIIIRQAVTRGLNPDASLKPSGVPWLGDIPAHWEVWRIGRFARVGNGSTPSRANPRFWSRGNYPWLNSSHVNRGFIDSADQFVTSTALRECHLPRVTAGSVLIAITGQGKTRGTSAVLGIEATINQHIAYITPRLPVLSAAFLRLSLVGAYSTLRAMSDDSGSTKGALTCEDLKRFKLAVPPVEEQDRLVAGIQRETQIIDTTIARTEREIALVQEYRTRLTADIVTGKLDVREAAARLPDLPADTAAEPPADEALEDLETEDA